MKKCAVLDVGHSRYLKTTILVENRGLVCLLAGDTATVHLCYRNLEATSEVGSGPWEGG